MTKPKHLAFALCLFCGMHASTYAQPEHGEPRGKLLYETHCIVCHASKIHWREQKLATDWNSLKFQVRRWQASIGLVWSEEEITDVTDYLNVIHYGFPITDEKGLSQTPHSVPAPVSRLKPAAFN